MKNERQKLAAALYEFHARGDAATIESLINAVESYINERQAKRIKRVR